MIRKIVRIMAAGLMTAILLPGTAVNAQAASGTTEGAFKPLSQVAMEAIERQEDSAADNADENVEIDEQLPAAEEKADGTDSADATSEATAAVEENSWQGEKLSRKNGTVKGPSGKETYFKLNMQKIVSDIKNRGRIWQGIDPSLRQNVSGDYHIREDGCKMLGQYIMVAANLRVHPRGSLIETSLGTGVVVDTGAFARSNAHQIDVAVNW